MTDDTSAEERYHLEAINALRMQCEAAIKPHIDRLVYLHSIKPRPIVITAEQAAAAGIAMYPDHTSVHVDTSQRPQSP